MHRAVQVHPLAGALPGVPMGGDADTIQAAGYGWRPGSPFTRDHLSVYRQVVDLGAPGSASFVIPGGASGDPDSPHFADQLARWAVHQRIPMSGAPGPGQPRRPGEPGSEDDDLGARSAGARCSSARSDGQVHAAVRPLGQAPPWNAMPPAAKNVAHGIGSW